MKNNNKRFMSALLVLMMLVSLMPTGIFAAKPNGLTTKDGYLWVEAENLKYDKDVFEKVKDKKMWSGGSALAVTSAVKDPVPAADEDAHIDLSFTADQNGTYAIWSRNTALSANGAGNSVYLSKDNGAYAYQGLKGNPEEPAWSQITSVKIKAGETASIRIRTRQMGNIAFDLFIISNEDGFRPSDQTTGLGNLIGVPVRSTPAPLEVGEDGILIVEAEDVREYNTRNYMLVDDTAASGGKALAPVSEDKSVPVNTDVADLDVSFKAKKPGVYSVWCRAKTSGNSNSNSIFLSTKKQFENYNYSALVSPENEYGWTKLATISIKDENSVGYVRICRRQAGIVRMDKFIITSVSGFIPTGKDDDPHNVKENKLPDNVYNKPSVTPTKGEHPRLWLHKEDIPKIKEDMNHPQNVATAERFRKNLDKEITVTEKYNGGLNWEYIDSRAFDYVINGNKEHGREAIEYYLQLAPIANYEGDNFAVRQYGGVISTGTKVYDWCYDLMTEDEKKEMIKQMEAKCYELSIGYPPKKGACITGHTSEGMMLEALLSLAISTYDERPDIYNYIMGKFFDEYVEPRNYWYQSHSYHQGTGYVGARFSWDLHAALMLKRSLGIEPFNMEDMRKTVYELIYLSRPDGQHFRIGDDYNTYNYVAGTYWASYGYVMNRAAALFGDEYLKREQTRCSVYYNAVGYSEQAENTPSLFLITNNVDVGEKLRDDLPLTMYMPSPNGQMVARTGWNDGYDAPDVVAYMKIGELYAANHAHLDMGHFQLYYKGILASDSGFYSGYGDAHHTKYQKASIAHNIVTVYDPNEVIQGGTLRDGGYQYPNGGAEPSNFDIWKEKYFMAEVTAHEYGPDTYTPEYNYLAGDLTKAYSVNSDKVSEALRSMVFMPLDDKDHPGAMVVFDKTTSKNKDFKKSWLLHMEEEPQVDGNKTIVTRTADGNNGRMVNETLLPKSVNIEKIGGEGKQYWVDGENIATKLSGKGNEAGWGRVEVSPKEASNTDYFLNVMTVSDADTTAPDIENTLIENDVVAGAAFANKAVVFNRNKARLEGSVSFTMPEGSYDLLVCGLKAGTWDVNGTEAIANEDGGCVYVKVNGGDITLTYKNDNANKTFTSNALTAPSEKIGIRVDNCYIYSDVDPVIVNDRTLVPMRAIFEKLDADVSYDDATATATAVREGKTVKITEGSNTAYVDGEAVELDVAATIINDRFVVPIRFVSESLGAKVDWAEVSKTVMITKPKAAGGALNHNPKGANEIKVVAVRDSGTEGGAVSEEENGMAQSLDGNLTTRWAINGSDYTNTWGIFDFGSTYTMDKIGIVFMSSDKRQGYFTIKVSEDGTTWTTVIDKAKSNDFTPEGEFEYFDMKGAKTRYLKYECGGNSINTWNSMCEFKFIKK